MSDMRQRLATLATVVALAMIGATQVGVAQDESPGADASAGPQPAATEPVPWPATELAGLEVWDGAIAAGNGRFVVVGRTGDGRATRAAVWTSTDGLDWSRVPASPELKDARMTAAAAFDGGFVAVGSVVREKSGETGKRIAMWYSPDGLGWERATVERPGSTSPEAWAQGVVAGPAGLLVYGSFGGQDLVRQRLWHSEDGLTWEVADFPGAENLVFTSLSGYPGGYLLTAVQQCLAVDCELEPSTSGQGGPLWRSEDGVTWVEVAGPPDSWPVDAAVSDDGTVVTIGSEPELAAIWVASDDGTWQLAWTGPDHGWDVGSQMVGVDWDGARFVATGLDASGDAVVLVSADGTNWVESTGPDGGSWADGETYLAGTASLDGTSIAVGSAGERTVVWRADDLLPATD